MSRQRKPHSIRERLRLLKRTARKVEHKLVLRTVTVGHLAYYTLVSIEAHGNYRYVAGGLGLLLLVEAIIGEDHPP